MTDRKLTVLLALREAGPGTAADVTDRTWPGSDARGTGQTLRRLRDDDKYVKRDGRGVWSLTAAGRDRARREERKLKAVAA